MKDMIVNASMILLTALMITDDNDDKEKEGANQTLQAEVIFRDG